MAGFPVTGFPGIFWPQGWNRHFRTRVLFGFPEDQRERIYNLLNDILAFIPARTRGFAYFYPKIQRMKMSRFYPIFLIPALLVTLLSCSAPKALEYRDFKNFGVEQLGFSSSSIKMDLVYYNPNNFGLQLKKTELDIFIDSTFLGHTSQDYLVTIPKRSEFFLPVKVEVDMKHIFKNALNTFFSNEVTVKVTGRVKVGKANVFMSMPVNYEGKHQLGIF